MHPAAKGLIERAPDDLQPFLATFFTAYDVMDRENAHLRLKTQAQGCPYGHQSSNGGCSLGYPGCCCMDDLLAMQQWSPADDDKAAVRMGQQLAEARRILKKVQAVLREAAVVMDACGEQKLAVQMTELASAKILVRP